MLSVDQIIHYPIARDLAENDLKALASVMVKRSFARDVYIFHPGNPGISTYLVESGTVRLFFCNAAGDEFLINLSGPRSVIGLPLMARDQMRLMGARSLTPCVLVSIPEEEVLHLMKTSAQFCLNVYSETAAASRRLLAHYQAMVTFDLDGRLAALVLNLAGGAGEAPLPISQADLAGWLGASRGQMNRTLMRFQKNGWLRVEAQKIVILKRQELARLAEGIPYGYV